MKITVTKLHKQFEGDLKEQLPFQSRFEQIDIDEDITLENKFQYLIQAIVAGSRARKIVNIFPSIKSQLLRI